MHEDKDRHGIIAILCPEVLPFLYNPSALGLPTDEAIERGFWPITTPQIQVPPDEAIKSCHISTLQNIEQRKTNEESRGFLNDTDWKVTRHNEQSAVNINTSLTTEEFAELLDERQQKRDSVVVS